MLPLLLLLGIAFMLYSICLTLYRLVLSPMAKFPGPKLAAASMWYEFYYDVIQHGQFYKEIERMHSIYGPIVRINPHEVHVRDPDWYNELYAAGGRRRDKSGWFVGRSGGQSIFGTVHHDLHRLRRSALNPFFSKSSVAALEPLIQDKVNKLGHALSPHVESGTAIELHTAFIALTLDVISGYAFGNSFGLVEKPGFDSEWKTAISSMIEAGISNRHLPWLADIMMNLPDSVAATISPPVAFFLKIQKDIRKVVEHTLASRSEESKSPRTIFQELRDSSLPPQEKTIERLMDEGLILVGAGGETTAQTLAGLTFHLLSNPDKLHKLTEELKQAIPDPQNPPSWQKLEQLPYLRATILEAHRVQAVITTRLIRIAPNEALQFREWTIPPNTPVSMSTHYMHLDANYFPEPYRFDPDRWLGPAQGLEKYVIPFSRGTRACIGLHLASAELHLTVASLFRRFEFELYETCYKDVEITWDGFSGGFSPESKGVRIKVVKEIS
ncbi:cytochrome P450 [Massariosphaeria phaeospora]|uniref:Cytochrome P450 n=1 Tax=Massariosphaeria phaeospora TaxID=100035 RepID=A0A7C8M8H6_9PLEO|nr:cytochrome P450 [Massariosphaeria phaeospora]